MKCLRFIVLTLIFFPQSVYPLAKYAEEFLGLGLGARSYGMGEAFTSLADDATSLYWNPAGTVQIDKKTVFFMHSSQFKDLMTYDAATFVLPGKNAKNALSFGILYLNIPDIFDTRNAWNDTNNDGIPDPDEIDYSEITQFNDTEIAFFLNASTRKNDKLCLGFNVKYFRKSFSDFSANGLGTDIGFLYIASEQIRIAAILKDFTGSFLLWNTGTKEFICPKLRSGVSVSTHFFFITDSRVTLSVDTEIRADHRLLSSQLSYKNINADFHLGMEYWFLDIIAVRIGSNCGALSAGLGISYKGINLDYAILAHEQLDNSQRLSGSINF